MNDIHELRSQIYISLGEASMCWSETPNGVFDSDRAIRIGERLEELIGRYIDHEVKEERKKQLKNFKMI